MGKLWRRLRYAEHTCKTQILIAFKAFALPRTVEEGERKGPHEEKNDAKYKDLCSDFSEVENKRFDAKQGLSPNDSDRAYRQIRTPQVDIAPFR